MKYTLLIGFLFCLSFNLKAAAVSGEASHCIIFVKDSGLFSSIKNICNDDVWVKFNHEPSCKNYSCAAKVSALSEEAISTIKSSKPVFAHACYYPKTPKKTSGYGDVSLFECD